MSVSEGFPPLFQEDAQVLILGSMPGVASLNAAQYYAHPRNLFWACVAESFGSDVPSAYDQRIDLLYRNRLALWDVLQSCYREGSLDSSIQTASEQANDFEGLLRTLPSLRCIFFNGKKAEQCFRKHVLSQSADWDERVQLVSLPSTSPANASIPRQQKLDEWKRAFRQYAVD